MMTRRRRGAAMAALRRDLAHHCGGLPLPGRDEPIYRQLASVGAGSAAARDENGRGSGYRARANRTQLRSRCRLPRCENSSNARCKARLSTLWEYSRTTASDLEQWQDEPVAQSILDRTTLLREVFWKARGNPELLGD